MIESSPGKYPVCPLAAAGLEIVRFNMLGPVVLGPDNRCICTEVKRCLNPDRKSTDRCTRADLNRLNMEANTRHAYQAGD